MKPLNTFLCVIIAGSVSVNGFFFGDPRIEPHAEVTQECLNHVATGACQFAECLEARFPCGHSGYARSVALHLCTKMNAMMNQLNPAGQRWANASLRCIAEKLAPVYQSPFMRCGDIRDAGANAMVECNSRVESDGTDFCWFVRENPTFYSNVFGDDIGRLIRLGPRVAAKMVTEAVTCGASALADRASSFTSRMGDLWRSMVEGIEDLLPWD